MTDNTYTEKELVDRLRYLARWGRVDPTDADLLREAAEFIEQFVPEEKEETNGN